MVMADATMPIAVSPAVRSASHAPRPAALPKPNACSIPTTVGRPWPPPDVRPVLRARLWNAEATAERCSPSSSDKLLDLPMSRPSADSTTARSAPATWLTKSSSSQSSSLTTEFAMVFSVSRIVAADVVLSGSAGSLLECRKPAASLLRCGGVLVVATGQVGGSGLLPQLRCQVLLPPSPGQRRPFPVERIRPARWGGRRRPIIRPTPLKWLFLGGPGLVAGPGAEVRARSPRQFPRQPRHMLCGHGPRLPRQFRFRHRFEQLPHRGPATVIGVFPGPVRARFGLPLSPCNVRAVRGARSVSGVPEDVEGGGVHAARDLRD